jgi:two-component system nitrate/nitrite response regulator NarL
MRRVRVLVVDGHQMLREALVGMLEASGFEVVGAVPDGADATALARELVPDVILMDLSMPVLNGLEATRLLREVVPATAVVVFSAFDSPDLKRQAFDAGAVAYLPKGCSNARLRATLEAAVTVAGSNLRRAGTALGP